MIHYQERRSRSFRQILEPDKKDYFIRRYALGQEYYLKHSYTYKIAKFLEYKGKARLITRIDENLVDHAILYKVFKKYVEISCTVVRRIQNNQYELEVKAIKLASVDREFSRKAILEEGSVSVSNIRITRNIINASLFHIPTVVKVHFHSYEDRLREMKLADEVYIRIFDRRDDKLEQVRKTSKIMYLRDTQDSNSYTSGNHEQFLDCSRVLNENVEKQMNSYRKSGIISEVIVPIIYKDYSGNNIPLGYFHLITRTKNIEGDTISQLKTMGVEIVQRIRDSNTIFIDKKENINNISKKGLQLKIEDEETKNYLVHQNGFSFDIIFRIQQPITVFAEIVYTAEIKDGPLIVGTEIYGGSSRRNDMKRYKDLLERL